MASPKKYFDVMVGPIFMGVTGDMERRYFEGYIMHLAAQKIFAVLRLRADRKQAGSLAPKHPTVCMHIGIHTQNGPV